jgi:cytochrome oxidase assembly protein ShyY1
MRGLALALAVILLAGTCVQLGRWQLHRLGDRKERNDITRSNLAAPPTPLHEVVGPGQPVGRQHEWRQVTATGRYDESKQIVIKYRNVKDRPGFEIVTPLLLDDGTAVLVDRGFLPRAGSSSAVPAIPPAPTGQVTITGRLRHSERGDREAVTPVDRQARLINAGAIGRATGLDLVDGYIAADDPAFTQPPLPELNGGPHFFYALQWFFFALLAIGGLVYFSREESRARRVADERSDVRTG